MTSISLSPLKPSRPNFSPPTRSNLRTRSNLEELRFDLKSKIQTTNKTFVKFDESPTTNRAGQSHRSNLLSDRHFVTNIQEMPQKPAIIAPSPSLKLGKLLSLNDRNRELGEKHAMRSTRSKCVTMDLGHYLDSLEENSERSLGTFRKKMMMKARIPMNDLQLEKSTSMNWMSDFLPQEVKDLSYRLESSRGYMPGYMPSLSPTNKYQKPSQDESFNKDRPGLTSFASLKKFNTETFNEEDNAVDNPIAKELANEVSANFRLYQEKAANNNDSNNLVLMLLEKEGVSDIFLLKTSKFVSLANRIYKDMIEPGRKILIPGKGDPKSKHAKLKVFQAPPKLIPSRYNIYNKINESLKDLTMGLKLKDLHNLETKLHLAHKGFLDRKVLTLKRIGKVESKRYRDLKMQCDNVEEMIPIYREMNSAHKYDDEDLSVTENSRFAVEARTMNQEFDKIFKEWKDSLM